jgi:hypothetical protein
MMLLGKPKQWIISSSSSAAFFAVPETKGLYLIHLEKKFNNHVNPSETSRGPLKRPDHVQAPTCKRPGCWNGLEFVGWNVSLIGEELVLLTMTD